MNTATASINCAHCKGKHSTVGEVKDCANGTVRTQDKLCMNLDPHPEHYSTDRRFRCEGIQSGAVEQRVLSSGVRGFATQPQLDYIHDLGGDPKPFVNLTYRAASHEIARLKKNPQKKESPTVSQAPNRVKTKIPIDFLMALKDGYYAAAQDDDHSMSFFRVSRPKSGQYQGAVKIQTQHGPEYKMMMEIWGGGERVYLHNVAVEDDLLLVVVDPNEANIKYAEKLGRCCKCNTELTDERSRYFGIGPDCEKRYPEIIDIVTDVKGPFKFGSGK